MYVLCQVTLRTWLEQDCKQDAQFWAVAANDLPALMFLAGIVKLDRPRLRSLAKLFDHREIWSYVTSLQSLAWEEVKLRDVAVTSNLGKQIVQ